MSERSGRMMMVRKLNPLRCGSTTCLTMHFLQSIFLQNLPTDRQEMGERGKARFASVSTGLVQEFLR